LSNPRARTVEVTNDDLILYHRRTTILLSSIEGASLGFLTFVILGIAIGLTSQILFGVSVPFLIFVLAGSFVLAEVGRRRNQIVRRIANLGFAWTYWSERVISWSFWVAVVLAVYAILSIKQIIPDYSIQISELLAGLYFLLATPQFLLGQLMTAPKAARLCLLQFLSDWNAGKPVVTTGHSWLRRALRGIEQRLKTFGIPAPAGELFFGSSYSLFKGHVSNVTFEELAKWLIEASNYSNVNWTIPFLLREAKQAEEDGFRRPRRMLSRRGLTLPEAESAILIVISVGTAIYGLLVHFGVLK
jgi:hypothetical protein